MKKISVFLCMCFSFLLLFATVASAITLELGPYKAKYANYETLLRPAANGQVYPGGTPPVAPDTSYYVNNGDGNQDNWGIFDITSFAPYPSGGSWWTDGQPEEVTGKFYNIDVQYWFFDSSENSTNIQSVGGQLDVYYDPSDNFDPTNPATATDGTLMVSFAFVPGIDPTNDTTVDGNFDGSTMPASGDGYAYLSVLHGVYGLGEGAWADYFDGDYWPVTWTDDSNVAHTGFADAYIRSNFQPNTDSTIPYALLSDDPVVGEIVPEPATMLLLGSGLIGLAGFARRKKFFKKD